MNGKKILAAGLAGVLAFSTLVTGCGTPKATETVATIAGEDGKTIEINYGVANFALKYQQAMYDSFYLAYMGEDMWTTDYGTGSMFDSVKTDVMDSLEQMYLLSDVAADYGVSLSDEDAAAIQTAADDFLAANGEDGLKNIGATDASVIKEYLEKYTLASRVKAAIEEETEITVTEEDAACKTIRYVRIDTTTASEDGEEATGDAAAKLLETAQAMADEMRSASAENGDIMLIADASADASASGDALVADAVEADADAFETIAKEHDYTATTYSYAADEDNLDAAVIAAVDAMEEGQISDAIQGDGAIYVVSYDSAYDADASASHYDELVYNQKSDHFNEVVEGLKASVTFTVNDSVWSKSTLEKLFTLVYSEEESTEEGTSGASEDAETVEE